MDIKEKYQLTSERLEETDFSLGFDHSWGWLIGGGFFCWKNRYGGTTFINSSGEWEHTPINRCVVCGADGVILSISTLDGYEGYELAENEHKEDGRPAFKLPEASELEGLVSALCKRIAGDNSCEEYYDFYLSDCEPSDDDETLLKDDKELQNLLAPRLIQMPYPRFLETAYWKIVKRIMRRRFHGCQMCGCKHGLEVHHKTYKHHGLELQHLDDLMLVCRDCHQKIHDKEN